MLPVPEPLAMAASARSFGMPDWRALMSTARSLALKFGSGPDLAATMISRATLVRIFAFFASCAPLRRATFFAWNGLPSETLFLKGRYRGFWRAGNRNLGP